MKAMKYLAILFNEEKLHHLEITKKKLSILRNLKAQVTATHTPQFHMRTISKHHAHVKNTLSRCLRTLAYIPGFRGDMGT